MPLDEYRRKRDPRRTPEPVPAEDPVAEGPGNRFVVQEHHARRLHWDVRLERDGVLASWAVPKGLPTDPDTVRLAVRTEDHPIEYLEFSGEIPAGEYGGGRMTIWDSGTYETEKWNPREVIVRLKGERASGRFVFIRTDRDGGKDNWLLRRSDRDGARAPLPHDVRPMIATPGDLPTGGEWWLQVGFGGERVVVRAEGGRIRITDAEGDEVAAPGLRGLGPSLGATQALFDAELVGDAEGAYLWIGDLLHLDGRDVCELPFRERRSLLERLPLDGPRWRLAPVFPGAGAEVVAAAKQQKLPHVVAKDPDSPYEPGRTSKRWVQVDTGIGGGAAAGGPRRPAAKAGYGRAALSNPTKVLYPLTGTTKADVLAYYLSVAEVMLPHLRDRPVTLVRWPDGVERGSFFEKDVSRHAPRWLRTARVGTPGGRSESADFPLIDDAEGLAWATNLAALELHVPQWRIGPDGAPQPPDLVVFDLDPGEGTTVVDCARVAERIAERLADDGLVAYPRTSGGKGMQLYVPVEVTRAEHTSQYAKAIAEELARESPQRVTAVMAKARRRGKVFVDWSQNNPHKTTIASYSLRGRAHPTVATPVTWEEVRACRRPEDLVFTAADVPARIAEHGDLMAPLLTQPQPLPARV
ncbi:MAG TPA: non-homologous end-joining DNA ligase [Pseudonocardia sp.]|uniref:non-homologous end-joining DNA ligase n=1 Tax=Pseudonocardia sp. TaxID=60912 RepID=UPI002B4B4F2A|nr:non-homologous end-joining DNA ligase [Pseudonocardia sp.]HLU57575.1 non-homologous end-joining DNA ligase [Pseudonocardia sp.]